MEHWKNLSLEDLEGEVWEDINGFECRYIVSNLGRIKSIDSNRILRQSTNRNNGYLKTSVPLEPKKRKLKTLRTHRIVAESFIPNPHKKETVNHIDGNKLNNTKSNLEWATYKEQSEHAYRLGLIKPPRMYGEDNSQCKLNKTEVRIIRRLKGKLSQVEIGKLFNVSGGVIGRIHRNEIWVNI